MKEAVISVGLALGASAAVAQPATQQFVFTGACDASAALLLPSGHLLVADDEDRQETRLRLYDPQRPGAPVQELDVTTALKPDAADPEVDLEGMTRMDGLMVLIGSHSRKGDDADDAPSRQRLLAASLEGSAPPYKAKAAGLYRNLQRDLQKFLDGQPGPRLVLDPEIPGEKKPDGTPKHKAAKDGGLSIEGLTSTAKPGELLIGFRSPLVPSPSGNARALAVLLSNAGAVLKKNDPPTFAPPIGLALDGLGIRDIAYVTERRAYLVVAGPPGPGGPFGLYEWPGPERRFPRKLGPIPAEEGTAPEVVVPEAGGHDVWILYDEGERKTASGKRCKSKDVAAVDKSFRAIRMAVP